MNQELSQEQINIRALSESKNPYAAGCPNRHLWSEGFRSGYEYKSPEEEAEYQQWKSGGWVSVENKEGMDAQPILFTDGYFIAMGHYWKESKEFIGNVAGCYDDRWTLEQVSKWQPLPKV